MRHTREPWARDGDEVWADNDCEHHPVATAHHGNGCRSEQEAIGNARRIVACVNACAGAKTEDLEALGSDYIKVYAQTIKQRDELLAALRGMMDAYLDICDEAEPNYRSYEFRKAKWDAAVAAIASVKEKA